MQIEGKNPIKEALDSDIEISKLYVGKNMHDIQPIIDKAKSKHIRLVFVDRAELDKLSETGRHQGLVAICEDFKYTPLSTIVENARTKKHDLFLVILDGIVDPHNLGSIVRVAECCGADGIVIPSRRAVGVTPTVQRVAAGATSHLPIAMVGNINDTIRELKENFVNVVCADMDGQNLYDSHLTGDIALVVGSEGEGVKSLTKKLCDTTVSIPQFGKVNSLNASVACGIICYEIVRQRMGK